MPEPQSQSIAKSAPRISLDTWAVLIALLAAVLIRAGAIPHVPW